MKTSNVRIINPRFHFEDNSLFTSIVYETSDFTAKSNNAQLTAETIFTITDIKKDKKSAIAKTITPSDIYKDATSDVTYTHTNKYIERFKTINTNLSVAEGASDVVYVIIAIPFNGTINAVSVTGNSAEVVSAHYAASDALKFNKDDKLLYSKLCYLMLKLTPGENGFEETEIAFTTVSSKWNEARTSCAQTIRNIVATIPVEFITNTSTDESMFVHPMVKNTNVFDAPVVDGKLATPPKRFNNLFNIEIDKTVKNMNNNNHGHKKNSYYTKKNDDIVTNFFSNDANRSDKPLNRKLKEAKKRYSEYDDE